MRVVSKFALAFFVAAAVCLSVFTWVVANREVDRMERVVTSGLTSFGIGLRPSVEAVWSAQGYPAAERMVGEYPHDGIIRMAIAASGGEGLPSTSVERIPAPEGRIVRVRLPLAGPDGQTGVLALERSVADGVAVIRADLQHELVAAAALAVLMAIAAALVGAYVIGGPLGRMVAQARRIGEGDFSQRLKSTGTDEIGVLKRELNAMCDRLQDAQTRLEEESAARVETLEQLRHLDRLRTIGTVASSIAHELGTPLNVLLLRGQSLAAGEIKDDEVEDTGHAVLSQVEKMSRIVRQLLAYARLRSTTSEAIAEVDALAVCRHACALLASLAKKHRVRIDLRGDEGIRLRGDFGQLEQALTNLIVNGIQAMPKGGVLSVRVSAPPGESVAAIDIVDEGEGMTPDVAAKIFDPFFTTKRGAEGTGLGLNVARGIAEDHGGTIKVASEPGAGSTFTLRLPRVP